MVSPNEALALLDNFSKETLDFILFAPFIIVLIVASRQIVGLRGMGIATPLLLIFLLDLAGVLAGLFVIGLTLAVSIALKTVTQQVHLLYLPRMGILLLGGVAGMLLLIMFWTNLVKDEMPGLTPLAFVTAVVLMENLFTSRRSFIPLAAELFIIALAGFGLLKLGTLYNAPAILPWFSFALGAVVLIFLGRWTGLRLSEYIRFKEFFANK